MAGPTAQLMLSVPTHAADFAEARFDGCCFASAAALRNRLYRPRTSTCAVIVHADVLAYAGNLISPQQQLCRYSTRSPASMYDRSWAPTASATTNDFPSTASAASSSSDLRKPTVGSPHVGYRRRGSATSPGATCVSRPCETKQAAHVGRLRGQTVSATKEQSA